jgi:hypothetical protein
MRDVRPILTTVLLVLAVTACTSGQPVGNPFSQASSVPPGYTGYANGTYYQGGTPTTLPVPTGTPAASPTPAAAATKKWPDFVRIRLWTLEVGWGSPDCPSLKRGNTSCRVPFLGDVLMGSVKRGRVLLLAYENDLPVPAAKRALEPISEGRTILCEAPGCAFDGAWLPYTPTPAAKHVRFKAELRDLKGNVLAFDWTGPYAVH